MYFECAKVLSRQATWIRVSLTNLPKQGHVIHIVVAIDYDCLLLLLSLLFSLLWLLFCCLILIRIYHSHCDCNKVRSVHATRLEKK